MRGHRVEEGLHDNGVATKQRRLQERHVRHDVRHMVLLRHNIDRPPHGGSDILACRVHVLTGWQRLKHLIRWNFKVAEKHLLNLTHIIHLRQIGRTLHDCLYLGKALRLREDSRVADRHNIQWPIKVSRANLNACVLRFNVFVGQVGAVDPVQDLKTPGHGIVQPGVNAAEDHHTLFNQRQRRADRLIGALV